MNNNQNSLLEDFEPRLNLVDIYILLLIPYFVIGTSDLYRHTSFENIIWGLKVSLLWELYILVLASIAITKTKLTGNKLVITYPYNPFRKTVELNIVDIERGKLNNFKFGVLPLSVWYKKASSGKLVKKVIPIRIYQKYLLHFIESLKRRGLTLEGGIAESYYGQIEAKQTLKM